jgi:hypothetical protein
MFFFFFFFFAVSDFCDLRLIPRSCFLGLHSTMESLPVCEYRKYDSFISVSISMFISFSYLIIIIIIYYLICFIFSFLGPSGSNLQHMDCLSQETSEGQRAECSEWIG